MRHFQVGAKVDRKEDESPVTQADREAESMLRERIEAAFPGEAVWGEEFGGDEELLDRWVLDPIDGTKSFICGVPLFATLVSYEVQGLPILGVAYFPALNEFVYAEKGQGAFWNGKPCKVSNVSRLAEASLCCGSHATAFETGRLDGIVELSRKSALMRTWGDAYGHCLVATGRCDAMIDPRVAHWDISAVGLIVREAGGKATGFDGSEAFGDAWVSSNGTLHTEVLGAFAS